MARRPTQSSELSQSHSRASPGESRVCCRTPLDRIVVRWNPCDAPRRAFGVLRSRCGAAVIARSSDLLWVRLGRSVGTVDILTRCTSESGRPRRFARRYDWPGATRSKWPIQVRTDRELERHGWRPMKLVRGSCSWTVIGRGQYRAARRGVKQQTPSVWARFTRVACSR